MVSSGALGAKTARCCDGCMKRRARWFCAADDAFLCQACDTSVHSANPLARRHERVRLKTASASSSATSSSSKASFAAAVAPLHVPASFHSFIDADADEDGDELGNIGGAGTPAWHKGFKRKARTPRGGGAAAARSPAKSCCASSVDKDDDDGGCSEGSKMLQMVSSLAVDPLVPDLDRASLEEFAATAAAAEEDQLLYRVPIFDPVLAEFRCPQEQLDADVKPSCIGSAASHETHNKSTANGANPAATTTTSSSQLPGFLLPSDLDLAEFEMDVENLLGRGLDDNSFCMDSLGLMDDAHAAARCSLTVKKEELEEEEEEEEAAGDNTARHPVLAWEAFDISSFDCDTPTLAGQDTSEMGEDQKPVLTADCNSPHAPPAKKRKIMLKLDYDAVITAWSEHGSPWTSGERPKLDPDDCWPDHTGMAWGGGPDGHAAVYGCLHVRPSQPGASCDGGREARVSRYREKRRTRLFSKKIRYEVRKLNAEKRPRMKGRFVKRASFVSAAAAAAGSAPTAAVGQVQYAY